MSLWSVVTAPVKSVVRTTKSVLHGDPKGALKNAVSVVASVNPAAQLNDLTTGKVAALTGKIPLVGSTASEYVTTATKLEQGDTSGSTIKGFAEGTAKLSAIAYGASVAAPALGLSPTTGAFGSAALVSGNFGAVAGLAVPEVSTYLPEGYQAEGQDLLNGLISGFFSASQPQPAITGPEPATIDYGRQGLSGLEIAVLGGALIASIALIRRFSK